MNESVPSTASSRHRRLALVAAAVVLALVAPACRRDTTPPAAAATVGTAKRAPAFTGEQTDKPVPGGKLIYGLSAETSGWNPSSNGWASSGRQVARSIFDTLTAFDERSQITPNLAQEVTPNADYTQWTIKLRPGVKLHNGKPVTAETVVRNQMFFRQSPFVGGAYSYVKGYSVGDELTVVVDLLEPWVTYPMSLATQIGVVADPDWLESNDSRRPIGTGPFVFGDWQVDRQLTVSKNPDYWRKDTAGVSYPYLDEIEFRVIPDDATREAALRARDVHLIQTISGKQIRDFERTKDFTVVSDAKAETDEMFAQLNTQAAPFDDIDARRALAYATDKTAIIEVVAGGANEPANGPYRPASPWHVKTDYPQHNKDRARELVEQVKARRGGAFTFTLLGSANREIEQVQPLLQQQWKAVGIDVQISRLDQADMITQVVAGGYQAVVWKQFGSPHPTLEGAWWSPELAVAPPAFSLNFSRVKDAELGLAQKRERAAADPKTRRDAVGVVQERITANVPFIWLYHLETGVIISPQVVSATNYRLPTGARGLDMEFGAHALFQVSLRP